MADANRALYEEHPWLADVAIERPPLGPGQLRKYEFELSALDGLGLSDREVDLTLTLVISFVRAHAATASAAGSVQDEIEWWAAAGRALARYATADDFPLSSRVGTAAGETQGRTHDPEVAYSFGLDRIADGVQALCRRSPGRRAQSTPRAVVCPAMHDVLDLREMLSDELIQLRESGHVVEPIHAPHDADDAAIRHALETLEQAGRAADWPYEEPESLESIVRSRSAAPPRRRLALDPADLRHRMHGAWLGRCAGCALGKPVENWSRADVRRYLERVDAYPLRDYIPANGPAPDGFPAFTDSWPVSVRGAIRGMPRDDDTDYTILGLHILETYGPSFDAGDVAHEWLRRLPFLAVYTAERAAYRNLIYGFTPPRTATHINPYREWIGAQIRADAYAYAAAGDPERAARMAYADAILSHTGNGVYGAMWAAALIASSFAERSMRDALGSALAVIPPGSRLAEALRRVADLHAASVTWEHARDELEERHGELNPVHTINNAAVVAAALLWGDGDFSATIGLAVQGGWDTDCNGATAGSAFGAMHGARSLPAHWTEPLQDTIHSALFGFDRMRISDLAERSFAVHISG